MDYTTRFDQADRATLRSAEPYDEDAIRWSAYRTMARSSDLHTIVRGVQGMTQMSLAASDNQVRKLREIIELMGQRITALTQENAQLKASIEALERKHIAAPDCEHGLPGDCCKICTGMHRISDIAKHEAYLDAWEASRNAEVER